MKQWLVNIILPLLAVAAAGCSNGDDGAPTEKVLTYDIVCLREVTEHGSTYTMTRPAGTSLITYHSRQRIDTERVAPGERMMLAYYPYDGVPYVSGYVEARGYAPIINDNLREGSIADFPDWDRDPVYLTSSWMSEDFLNIRAGLPVDDEERSLAVMVEKSTVGTPYPDCYLVHTLKEPVNTFDRNYYISVDMSELRKVEGCKGFRLHLNNSNLKQDVFTYDFLDYK